MSRLIAAQLVSIAALSQQSPVEPYDALTCQSASRFENSSDLY
jgi:hypothetical protein